MWITKGYLGTSHGGLQRSRALVGFLWSTLGGLKSNALGGLGWCQDCKVWAITSLIPVDGKGRTYELEMR